MLLSSLQNIILVSKVTGINANTLVIPDVRLFDDNTYTCTIVMMEVVSHQIKLNLQLLV